MQHTNRPSTLTRIEFVAIMALLMSLLALSIDTIMPALTQIGNGLGVDPRNPNDNQTLLSTIFLGMSLGLIFYGPLSDSYGRKKIIYLGIGIFICGTVICLVSTNFTLMLVGPVIQGFGGASCRVVSIAMIRDRFEGVEMAKIMSLITMIFIIVPAIAPSIGQVILLFAGWKMIFTFGLVVSLISVTWMHTRLPETLVAQDRKDFSFTVIKNAAKETVKAPASCGYTIASGLMFGSFVGYLSSAQQILQLQYSLGDKFSIVFGGLAIVIGVASFVNTRLLRIFNMERLCLFALTSSSVISIVFYLYMSSLSEQPPLIALLLYFAAIFFHNGLLVGNLSAMALSPLGHIAGTATSVISAIQTLISVLIGSLIGYFYNNSIAPLVLGVLLTRVAALLISLFITHQKKRQETQVETIGKSANAET